MIATLTTQADAAGHAGADLHRRPRRAAAGQRPRHRALPAPRRQRDDPVHAGGGRGEVRPHAGAVPRLRRAARRPERQPAQHPRRRREDRREVGPRVRHPRRPGRPASTRSRARSATRCASTSPACCATASSPSWSATSTLDVDRRRPRPAAVGPRRGAQALRRPAVPGAARAAVRRRSPPPSRRPRRASTSLRPARRRRGRAVARRARPRRRAGRRGLPRPVGPRHRHADRRRARRRRRRRGLPRPVPAEPGRRRGAGARGSPTRPCPRPRTTSRARCSRCASTAGRIAGVTSDTQLAAYLLRPDQRTFDLADLALRYLRRELRSNVEESGQLTLDGGLDESDDALAEVETVQATADPGPRRRVRRRARTAAARRGCSPSWNCR